jgi:hypothetical protein
MQFLYFTDPRKNKGIKGSSGQMVGATSDPVGVLYRITVEYAPHFPEPTEAQIDSSLRQCFAPPQADILIGYVRDEMDLSNPFSAVESVAYSTAPPALSDERPSNASSVAAAAVPVTPFFVTFDGVHPQQAQDFDAVTTVTRNHVHVCLRQHYNRTVDATGLADSYRSAVAPVRMKWEGEVAFSWAPAEVPTTPELDQVLSGCFQNSTAGDVYVRELRNLPASNSFSNVTGVAFAAGSSPAIAQGEAKSGPRLSPGAVAGIVVGAVFYVAVHVLCFCYIYQKRRNRVHHRDRDEHRSGPSSPPSTMAWVQPEPESWLSRLYNMGGMRPLWNAREPTDEASVPRILSMPHHSKSGSSATPSGNRTTASNDVNLMFFMKENNDDLTRTRSSTRKSNRKARV